MEIGEFFKPTKWKIISTIILSMVAFFCLLLVAGLSMAFPNGCSKDLPFFDSVTCFGTILLEIIISPFIFIIGFGLNPSNPTFFFPIAILLQIILNYFIVCLIVYIINKIRNRNQ